MVSVQEAGDLVQEVFLSALRSIDRLAEPERVGPWLCTIARNRARDVYRSRGAAEPVVNLDEVHETAVEPAAVRGEADGADQEEAEHALQTVRELPDAYRETLVLRLVEGMTGPQIAERMGMTHGSVRVNLHRGMKLLRERLLRGGPGVEGTVT
jgi:RNA polymerase sigma-70 factor (ECF subfamily)